MKHHLPCEITHPTHVSVFRFTLIRKAAVLSGWLVIIPR